jgi:hypothetical protein
MEGFRKAWASEVNHYTTPEVWEYLFKQIDHILCLAVCEAVKLIFIISSAKN